MFDSVFSILALFTIVVFIHELGHFLVARYCGVAVEVFSVGFGKELFGFYDKQGTRWRFSLIPLGGYIKMRGDENAASMPSAGARHIEGSFENARLGAKIAIIAAGPIANFLLAITLFAGVYMGVGKAFIPATIAEVLPESAAESAGLLAGDKMISVDGRPIRDFGDIRGAVFEAAGRELILEIDRDGRLIELPVVPDAVWSEELSLNVGRLGVRSAEGEWRRLGPINALSTATVDTVYMTGAMIRGLQRIVTGNFQRGEIGGPVRIAELTTDAWKQGVTAFVVFIAVISINLGLMNLLPIPPLDGGHLLFFFIEAVSGRAVPDAIKMQIMRAGIAFVLSLMVVVTIFDILPI